MSQVLHNFSFSKNDDSILKAMISKLMIDHFIDYNKLCVII